MEDTQVSQQTFTLEQVQELLRQASQVVKKQRKPREKKPPKPKELWQTPNYLLNVPEEDLDSLSKEYDILGEDIVRIAKGFHNYMRQEGFLYSKKDYKAVLESRLEKERQKRHKVVPTEAVVASPKFDNIDLDFDGY